MNTYTSQIKVKKLKYENMGSEVEEMGSGRWKSAPFERRLKLMKNWTNALYSYDVPGLHGLLISSFSALLSQYCEHCID